MGPTNLKGGRGPDDEVGRKLEGQLTYDAPTQDLSGSVEHAARVHTGGKHLKTAPPRDSLQQEAFRAGGQTCERGYPPRLELRAQR